MNSALTQVAVLGHDERSRDLRGPHHCHVAVEAPKDVWRELGTRLS